MTKTRKYRKKFGGVNTDDDSDDEDWEVAFERGDDLHISDKEENNDSEEEEYIPRKQPPTEITEEQKIMTGLKSWTDKRDNEKIKEWVRNFKACILYELKKKGWDEETLHKLKESMTHTYYDIISGFKRGEKVIYIPFNQTILGLPAAEEANHPHATNKTFPDAHFTLFSSNTFSGFRGDHITLRFKDQSGRTGSYHEYRSGERNFKLDLPAKKPHVDEEWLTEFDNQINNKLLDELSDAAWRVGSFGKSPGCIARDGLVGFYKPNNDLWNWKARWRGGKRTRKQRKQKTKKTKDKKSKTKKSRRVKKRN